MTDAAASSEKREVILGMLVTFGWSVALGGVLPSVLAGLIAALPGGDALSGLMIAIPLGIGLTQLLWVVPLHLRYQRLGLKARGKGLVIAAAITFLLNASCWGAMLAMFSAGPH